MTDLGNLETSIGYGFQDRELLKVALTHSSYASEHHKSYRNNNERLEFIGDAFLDAIVGRRLFEILPDAHEGNLTKIRANIVCERSLAGIARTLSLGDYLLLGNGELQTGGREKDSILADAVEAVIGAVILDGGYATAERVVLDLFFDNIRLAVQGKLYRDYKTELQERLQERFKTVRIVYEMVAESGPDHAKEFTVEVSALGQRLGIGTGRSKKEAEQNAARDALQKGDL